VTLTLAEKQTVVLEVSELASTAYSIIAAEYRGMTVAEMTQLRVRAREAGVSLKVARNTLAKRALSDTSFACMTDGLMGPLILAFSRSDPAAAARIMSDYAKANDKLKIKLVAVSGRLLDAKDVITLAYLPSREQALAILMSTMLGPITMLARTLNEPHARLVRLLAAVRDRRQAA
jgi:large subunit ribosomal protein L10